jgi:predicted helicase
MNKTEKDTWQNILTTYLKELHAIYAAGNFREESFYPAMKDLFEKCSQIFSVGAGVLVSPKRTEVGIPDFLIRKDGEIIGYIEAKTPDSNLHDVERSEQLQRYRTALPNLIVTNFLEFVLYKDGTRIKDVEISRFSDLEGFGHPVPDNMDYFSELLREFYSFSVPEITSASRLAVELAKRARFLDVVLAEVYEKKEGLGFVSIHHVFQESLIETLSKDRFVDLCAQTITYGLFALTNSLEMKEPEQVPLLAELTEEGREAKKVKEDVPILVILGNPPYSGISENKGKWITGLIEDYKYVDGKHFGEKKHWLQDDYVKFIRFGQWKIDRTGEGVLGFITNHSYLDNPTFRGMRQSLLKSFDTIYLLNLHGNALKKEKCPDGSKDENVFDIRQGVAIGLFIKNRSLQKNALPEKEQEKKEGGIAKVYYAERWGLRKDKYRWLLRHDLEKTDWEELKPSSPFYFFVPREEAYWDEYERYWKITDIMPENSVGIVTARDHLTIQDSPEKVWKIVQDFSALPEEIARSKYNLGKDAQDWKVSFAQNDLRESGLKKEFIVPILYRPFDIKYSYYTGHSRGFVCMPRPKVMRHMMKENIALCAMRQVALDEKYTHFLVSQYIVDNRTFLSSKGIIQQFPLYPYPEEPKGKLSNDKASKPERIPNISNAFLHAVKEALGTEPTPEEIFYYIYAVLYSPGYRKRYEEFLKVDFPRVPLPTDYEKFRNLSELGKELVELHLLKHPSLSETGIGFPKSGSNRVENVRYDEENRRVYFNNEQYFECISKAVWAYQIGGYQVMMKYLKDRKKRELSLEEIEHYMRVARAIERTREVQEMVDEVFRLE